MVLQKRRTYKPHIVASLGVMAVLVSAQAQAGDISLFGGRTLSDGENLNSVALSAGVDIPKTFGPFSPTELRVDLGYLFTSLETPLGPDVADTLLNTDFGTFTAHIGPAWRLNFFDKASVFAGAQAGIAVFRADFDFVGPPPPAIDIFDEITDSNFSYQFPVGVEYSFTNRVGFTGRYRAIGVTGANNGIDHILEAGVILKF